jgi:lysophospholipase L1-like esterase
VKHEGYCGTVIAPPGVYAVHGYTTTNAYLLRIVADALAIATNRPDIVLLLIGTNDIGRGRDPHTVGGVDMPALLDLIQSVVPDVNIILARITSLQSATLAGYAAYATNVLVYNSVLQSMVNQRRSAGQNVFLADMLSAVDYKTMFLADHVHPNTAGVKSMAAEWMSRIQAITLRSNFIASTLIDVGSNWNYRNNGQEPDTHWMEPGYDDSGWSNGVARFGYGDPAVMTPLSYGPNPDQKYLSAYFRRVFTVPRHTGITNLNIRLACADGAAVSLNGQELFRTNLPVGPLTSGTLATSTMTGYTAQVFYQLDLPVPPLAPGTNLLAVEVHLANPTNSLAFDLEMIGSGSAIPPPSLATELHANTLRLSWPMTNDTFELYSSTNILVPGSWQRLAEPLQTNGDTLLASPLLDAPVKFFRLIERR